jgi:hypothetical protein
MDRSRHWPVVRLIGRLFVGIGSDETDAARRAEASALPEAHPPKPLATHRHGRRCPGVRRELRSQGNRDLAIGRAVFAGEYHATAAAVCLTRGLRFCIGDVARSKRH